MKEEKPIELEPVLAKISHQNDLGNPQWYEVVYYVDGKWCSYSGSKTFDDGERVVEWVYCSEQFKQQDKMKREKQLSPVAFLQREVNTFLTNDQKKILKDVWERAEEIEKEQRKIIQLEILNSLQKELDGNNTEENNLWHKINKLKETFKQQEQ